MSRFIVTASTGGCERCKQENLAINELAATRFLRHPG
jgi:hypothetical protein